jgi:hypothetical protein
MKLRARFFLFMFCTFARLVTNRNKFFNTTDAQAPRPGGLLGRGNGATEEVQVVRVRSTRRGRPEVAVVAYVAQRTVTVATAPGSGKEAATGLNVSADGVIPEHGYSLEYITNGKSLFYSCWRAAEFIGHSSIRRDR